MLILPVFHNAINFYSTTHCNSLYAQSFSRYISTLLTVTCPETYEYVDCGSPCTKTCDNYNDDVICAAVCHSGCFCPGETVEHNNMCITTDLCPG